jgi:hypothetical protein
LKSPSRAPPKRFNTGLTCPTNNYFGQQWKEIDAKEYTGLQDAVQTIVHVLESQAAQQAKDPLPVWLAEIGFAAGYLLKRYDFIPDHVPSIGLADDVLTHLRQFEKLDRWR